MISDDWKFLRTQHDTAMVAGHIASFRQHRGAERECRGRGRCHLARLQQTNHSVLNYFRVGSESRNGLLRVRKERIRNMPTPDCSGSRFAGIRLLYFQLRNSRMWPAIAWKPHRALKVAVAIGRIRQHDGDDLLRGNFEVRRADALAGRSSGIGPRLEAAATRNKCRACPRALTAAKS